MTEEAYMKCANGKFHKITTLKCTMCEAEKEVFYEIKLMLDNWNCRDNKDMQRIISTIRQRIINIEISQFSPSAEGALNSGLKKSAD